MDVMQIFMFIMPIASCLGGVVGAIGGVYNVQKSQKKGIKLILKMQLRTLHKAICVNGEPCTIDDKDDATQLYDTYEALGGNGTGKSMYQDIMQTKVSAK